MLKLSFNKKEGKEMDVKLLKDLIKEALLIIEKKRFSEKEVSVTKEQNKVIFKYKGTQIVISKIDSLELIKGSNVGFYDLSRMMQIVDKAFADYKTLALRGR